MSTFLYGETSKIMERESITWNIVMSRTYLYTRYTRILKSISFKCSLSCFVIMYLQDAPRNSFVKT